MTELSNFFKTAITVDNVIFGFDGLHLKVLLIKRGEEPYLNEWALPGYFVQLDEDLDDAAQRVLEELTGLKQVYLEQVHTFGTAKRHPVGRVMTVAYYSLLNIKKYQIRPASIAQKATWYNVKQVKTMNLAFDHNLILDACTARLKQKVKRQPIGFELLPNKFTLSELKHLYEAILEQELDKRNFRKKILSMNVLIDLKESQEGVAHRPAKLYSFDLEKYKGLLEEGFHFDLSYPPKVANKEKSY